MCCNICQFIIHCTGPFLVHLEALLVSQRAEEHRSLLTWCVQSLHSAQRNEPVQEAMEVSSSQTAVKEQQSAESTADAHLVAEERKRKAHANREKLMAQMATMQKKFLEKHKEELDEVDYVAETKMQVF